MLHTRIALDAAMPPSRIEDIVALQAQIHADRMALVEETRRWTYGELQNAVRATAAWLRQNGIQSGDRLMLVCENSCAAIALYFAATTIGAWPVIVSARL